MQATRFAPGCFLVLVLVLSSPDPRGARAAARETLSFTIVGIDCEKCADPILEALKSVGGARKPRLDWQAGRGSVEIEAGFDRERIRKAIRKLGFEAVFPGEEPRDLVPLTAEEVQALDIRSYDGTSRVDLEAMLAPGRVTVVDFHADWCSPCKLLETRLHHLLQQDEQLALRRVDVGNWDNAAAKQATDELKVAALPYLRIYDAGGRLVEAVTGGCWDDVMDAIHRARQVQR